MKEMDADKSIEQDHPLIVELVGLAGSGKTTLSRALNHESEKIRIGSEIELRKIKHIPVFGIILKVIFIKIKIALLIY